MIDQKGPMEGSSAYLPVDPLPVDGAASAMGGGEDDRQKLW